MNEHLEADLGPSKIPRMLMMMSWIVQAADGSIFVRAVMWPEFHWGFLNTKT